MALGDIALDWIFPNVEGVRVNPTVIRPYFDGNNRTARTNLTQKEVADLGLSRVGQAAAALDGAQLHREQRPDLWSIRPVRFDDRTFRGPSAQLAALLALVEHSGVQARIRSSWLRGEVWATGGVAQDAAGTPVIEPVGGAPDTDHRDTLRRKAQAFRTASEGRLFLAAQVDVEAVAEVFAEGPFTVCDLDAFAAHATAPDRIGVRYVVGVRPHELRRLLATIFVDLFLPAPRVLAVLYMAVGPAKGTPRDLDAWTEAFPPLHSETRTDLQVVLFQSAEAAFDAALAWLHGTARASTPWPCVALYLGAVRWDGLGVDEDTLTLGRALLGAATTNLVLTSVHAAQTLARTRELCGVRHGYVRIGALSHRLEAFNLTDDTDAGVIYPAQGPPTQWSLPAAVVAWMFTCSRLPLGIVTGWYLYQGRFTAALGFYGLGLATDVFDGAIARLYHGDTTSGKRLDPFLDMIFNALATAGFVAGAAARGEHPWWTFGPLACTLGLVVASRPWVEPDSALAKLRSGVVRLFLVLFILFKLRWTQVDVVIVVALGFLGVVGALYEWKVLKDAVDGNETGWWTAPRYRPKRPDQRLLDALVGRVRARGHRP